MSSGSLEAVVFGVVLGVIAVAALWSMLRGSRTSGRGEKKSER